MVDLYDIAQVEYPLNAAGKALKNNILATLNKYYPDMFPGWSVTVMQEQDWVVVKNMQLSGKMGFGMAISKMDPELRCIIRTGGELLERYEIARTKRINKEKIMDVKIDYRGEAIPQL